MRRSLRGRRVVVTRAEHQADDLADLLRGAGAEPVLLPMIGLAAPADPMPLAEAATNVNDYDWVIFTSANAVRIFASILPDTGAWFRPRVAVVGGATAETAEEHGFRVELVPEKFVGEALAAAFADIPLGGKRVLIPAAAGARDVVANALRERGAAVNMVETYRNVIPEEAPARAKEVFRDPLPDWVTFASSSAVRHLVELTGVDVLREVAIASIGPVTSKTAEELGLRVTAEARVSTAAGMVEAMRGG